MTAPVHLSQKVYKLYGIRREIFTTLKGDREVEEYKEIVATFSKESLAETYARKQMLKRPIRDSPFTIGRTFRFNTSMGMYQDYRIEYGYLVDIPHDPE